MLLFDEGGKPEYPEKNLSVQRREPTNSTHMWRRVWNRTRATLVEGDCSHHCAATYFFIVLAKLVMFIKFDLGYNPFANGFG